MTWAKYLNLIFWLNFWLNRIMAVACAGFGLWTGHDWFWVGAWLAGMSSFVSWYLEAVWCGDS